VNPASEGCPKVGARLGRDRSLGRWRDAILGYLMLDEGGEMSDEDIGRDPSVGWSD
jgi:hypothetical protein